MSSSTAGGSRSSGSRDQDKDKAKAKDKSSSFSSRRQLPPPVPEPGSVTSSGVEIVVQPPVAAQINVPLYGQPVALAQLVTLPPGDSFSSVWAIAFLYHASTNQMCEPGELQGLISRTSWLLPPDFYERYRARQGRSRSAIPRSGSSRGEQPPSNVRDLYFPFPELTVTTPGTYYIVISVHATNPRYNGSNQYLFDLGSARTIDFTVYAHDVPPRRPSDYALAVLDALRLESAPGMEVPEVVLRWRYPWL